MSIENPEGKGVAGNEAVSPPAPTAPKLEFKDGSIFADGKKMVRESDLLAAKQSLESAATKAQQAHSEAIDTAKLELSAEQKKVADLNAKLQQAQSAPGQGATEDVAKVKQELADAKSKVESLTKEVGGTLELKKRLIKVQYSGVTDEQLANKDIKALDSFEEALKAVSSIRGGGVGPYATGGMGQAGPMSDLDRAKKILEVTPVRGTRNAPEQK